MVNGHRYKAIQIPMEGLCPPKPKRVHYKNTKRKVYKELIQDGEFLSDDMALWGEMKSVYAALANYFPPPLFSFNDSEFFDCGIVRVWKSVYTAESYEYSGTIFNGQNFTVLEAEIIGTENLPVNVRLFLHKLLLDRLRAGMMPDAATFDIIEYLKKQLKQL